MASNATILAEMGDGIFDPSKKNFADSIMALSNHLKLVDYYTPANVGWITKKDLD